MKKILSICLMMALVVIMSVNAFAAPNGFVNSPSGSTGPGLVDSTNESEDCSAKIVITPYSERDTLSDELREKMEKAYSDITGASDLTDVCGDLEGLAKKMKIDPEDLAISDMFDINYIGCGDHEGHGYFDIVLKADSLKGFVALLHNNDNGWEIIKNAKVKQVKGEWHLSFSVEDFSPFAIVVNASTSGNSPQTGDNSMVTLYVAILAAVIFALIALVIKSRKQNA